MMYPGNHSFKRDAAAGMGLGVKKHLAMAHALRMRFGKVCPGQIVEIPFINQRTDTLIIKLEKRLQVSKFIRFTQIVDGLEWKCQSVTARKLKHLLGFQGTLDMDMQFRLWQAFNKFF